MVSSRRRKPGEQTFGGIVLWLVVASALFVACSGKMTQAGGLELLLETDLPTPATFDTVNVKLEQQAPGSTWRLFHQRDYVIPNEMALPTTIALMAGQSPYENVRITVTGLAGRPAQPIVQRVVQTQVPSDRVDEVLLVLSSRCVGKLACPAGDSCQPDLGVCGPNTIASLHPYNPADLTDAGVPSKLGPRAVGASDAGPNDATVDTADAGAVDATDAAGSVVEGGACVESSLGCNGQQPQTCTNGQWQDVGTPCAAQACVAGSCQGVCAPKKTRCSNNGVETCNDTGAWGAAVACPAATAFCNGIGVCGACADGTTQCSGGGVETCVTGAWLNPVPCMNQACAMGACSGTCQPGGAQCSGNGAQKCDPTGHWSTPMSCGAQACVGGACQGVCFPGDSRCSSNGVEKCSATGAWVPTTSCGTHQSCSGGAGAGPAVCSCNTDPACTAAATAGPTCAGAATIATCAQDGQGCWYASSPSPCTNGACFGSAGSAQCCANACSNGSKQCGGAGIETCQVQGNGCTAWNAGAACVGHQHCAGPSGSATCACNADPNCSKAGAVCSNATTSATCSQDGPGCFYTASTTLCMANQTCSGGNCSCSSGFTLCGGGCVNVNNDSSNCGSCGHACPVLASPGSGATCMSTTCQGNIGGYVQAGGSVSLDPNAGTSYFVSATMPGTSGTFVGVGATVGSQDTSGSTPFILGLYADSGGAPGNLLFYTDQPASVPNPSSPVALTSMSVGGSYTNGFTGTLTANTTYWVYLHPGPGGSSLMATAAVSNSPCVGAMWINVMPPTMGSFATATSCPGNLDLYLIAKFP